MKKWMFTEGLPFLVELNIIPIGASYFDTELEAVNAKLAIFDIIQRDLEERKRILGYAEIDRQNKMHMEDERIFNQITGI